MLSLTLLNCFMGNIENDCFMLKNFIRTCFINFEIIFCLTSSYTGHARMCDQHYCCYCFHVSPVMRKLIPGVSDQVRYNDLHNHRRCFLWYGGLITWQFGWSQPRYSELTETMSGHKSLKFCTSGWKANLSVSCDVRKPDFCICENKDADQLRGNREADQHLCFRYTDSTIPPLPNSEISSL